MSCINSVKSLQTLYFSKKNKEIKKFKKWQKKWARTTIYVYCGISANTNSFYQHIENTNRHEYLFFGKKFEHTIKLLESYFVWPSVYAVCIGSTIC